MSRAFGTIVSAAVVLAGVSSTTSPAYADDARNNSWHLQQLRVAEAHRITQGEGITVAVVDTGVNPNHPDLAGNVLSGVDILDPANPNHGQRDETGHGTAIASLIVGHGHGPNGSDGVLGIAPKARIVPYNVYDAKAKGAAQGAPPGAIAKAIRLAVDQGADLISIALAGGFERNEEAVVKYAHSRGVLVVAGVGNPPHAVVLDPAGIPEAVAVTAVDRNGKPATTVRGWPSREIDIAAPGADMVAAVRGGGYYTATGTSASTAIVAGAVALIRAKYPKAGPDELLQRLIGTTTDAGAPGLDPEYGWGMLNLVNALTMEPRGPGVVGPSSLPAQSSAKAADHSSAGDRGIVVALVVGFGILLIATVVMVIMLIIKRRRSLKFERNGG